MCQGKISDQDCKRALICLPNDALGGAEQYLKMISVYLIKGGFHVTVCFLKKQTAGGWIDLQGSNITFLYTNAASEKAGLISFIRNIRRLRKEKFDLTFTSHVHLNSLMGVLRKWNIIKTSYFVARESTSIFERYRGFRRLFFTSLYHFGYTNVDLLICQSRSMKAQLLRNLPWMEKEINVKVIPNPIDIVGIRNVSTEIDPSLKYDKFLVAAGRLIPEKGFDILIRVFGKMKSEFKGLKLYILGEGEQRGHLQSLIGSLGLEGQIVLYGHVKNVYPFFKHAEVCVVSSRIEGFPNVLLQMMSQNDTVVSTKCAGGIEEIKGLFLAEPEQEESLGTAIKQALTHRDSDRRFLFDQELVARDIQCFFGKINDYTGQQKINQTR